MLRLIKKGIISDSAYSLYAQACLLLANFTLFVVLIKGADTSSFGHWALFITLISITDSFRQGLLQNGFIRLYIQQNDQQASLITTAGIINFAFIGLSSLGFLVVAALQDVGLFRELLFHGFKSLLALGSLQFLNMLNIAQKDFKGYFIQNFIYLCGIALGMLWLFLRGSVGFIEIINLQLLASGLVFIVYMLRKPQAWAKPKTSQFKALWAFGKYAAGTNLLSMLFHKADVLMLAFFTNPATVALFHFATKITGYTDLPMNACSQVIYPELATSYRKNNETHLKRTYLKSILRLLALATPIIIAVMLFNKEIIKILSTDDYSSSSAVIIILLLGALIKPVGRVFGLLLDAMGKPKVNFQMLAFSLVVNVTMNLTLIPSLGIIGAAIATSTSIVLTVLVGQIRLRKWLRVRLKDLTPFYQNVKGKIVFT